MMYLSIGIIDSKINKLILSLLNRKMINWLKLCKIHKRNFIKELIEFIIIKFMLYYKNQTF